MELIDILADGIADWLKGGTNRSLSGLSSLSDIPYTTLRRWSCKEVKRFDREEMVVSLIYRLFSKSKADEVVSLFFPTLYKGFVEDRFDSRPVSESQLEDSMSFIVMGYCASVPCGADRLSSRWGKRAVLVADRLVELGVLELTNGLYHLRDGDVASFLQESSHKSYLNMKSILDEMLISSSEAIYNYTIQGVNERAHSKLKLALKDYLAVRDEIFSNKDLVGTIIYADIHFLNVLGRDNEDA